MIRELDIVALTHDLKDEHLKEGDTGTVVDCSQDGRHFIVEFIDPDGTTTAVLPVTHQDIRLVQSMTPRKD
jgi:hypothetical protein